MLTIGVIVLALGGVAAWWNSAAYASRVNDAYPAEGHMVEVNGADVHVLEQGVDGPVVLMIMAPLQMRASLHGPWPHASQRHTAS